MTECKDHFGNGMMMNKLSLCCNSKLIEKFRCFICENCRKIVRYK